MRSAGLHVQDVLAAAEHVRRKQIAEPAPSKQRRPPDLASSVAHLIDRINEQRPDIRSALIALGRDMFGRYADRGLWGSLGGFALSYAGQLPVRAAQNHLRIAPF